jgi:four helix bundle protein
VIGEIGIDSASSMRMTQADDLQERTRVFAITAIQFCRSISRSSETDRITSQLIGSATSVGANFRAARRARSHAEFTAKMGVVAEEADECEYWLTLICALRLGDSGRAERLHQESIELMRILESQRGRHGDIGDWVIGDWVICSSLATRALGHRPGSAGGRCGV